ncbi:MAG: ribonuclease Z [Lachnospiraceae bacterium]|nr:ribonuclease Z [Lachnospiraceae bacterium]
MLDVCLLGCGGMMPLPYRWLTSLMVRYNGKSILIDCGEGTQIAMKEKGWSPKPIDVILFTHYHADHISGLPGLLLTIGNAERTEPLTIIGPKGTTAIVGHLRAIAPELPFEIKCVEIEGDEQEFNLCGLRVKAFKVKHNIICYGYTMELDRLGRFDPERAKAAGIDVRYWNRLQHGEEIVLDDGAILTPSMVMGEQRRGLKLSYVTDTRPTPAINNNVTGSDLFICEGMYGEPDSEDKARTHKHMTFREAARIAKDSDVKEMWLTHYSPSLVKAEFYMEDVRKIFENTRAGKDGMTTVLKFEEE